MAKKHESPWQNGCLFHATTRYPRKAGLPRVDRLAGILKRGIVAPGCCTEGVVRSDLSITVTGCSEAYDRLVFLHRFGRVSGIYTMCDAGKFFVFVDSEFPVLTQDDMGPHWPILCQDEVYVRETVPVDRLTAVAVHPDDAAAVKREFIDDFKRLAIPLFTVDAKLIWSPG